MKACKAGNSETLKTGSASRDCDRQVWLRLSLLERLHEVLLSAGAYEGLGARQRYYYIHIRS